MLSPCYEGAGGATSGLDWNWRGWNDSTVNKHRMIYFEADETELADGVASVAAVVPGHYAAPARITVSVSSGSGNPKPRRTSGEAADRPKRSPAREMSGRSWPQALWTSSPATWSAS